MPNPGAFHGSRKAFLVSKKPEFRESVVSGYTSELLASIQRQYFKRYPIDLPHDQEPTAEHLAAVDDDAPDPEIEEPDETAMSPEDYKLAMDAIAQRKVEVTKRRAQIKRWFIYQYMKDHDSDTKDLRAASPYQVFLAQLRGSEPEKPRRKSAVNIWRKIHRKRIDKLSKLTAERENIGKSKMAALRDRIARELFNKLSLDEQREWAQSALDEHKRVLEEWEKARTREVSTEPADRQRAIQGLVRFIQPALNVIADATGWKVSLFAGGPEPALDGMFNVISVHSGTTGGDIKLTFGQSERASIKKDVIPIFGTFLQKCFSPEECRARALSELEGFVSISDMELEGSTAIIHPLGPEPTGSLASTPAPSLTNAGDRGPTIAPSSTPVAPATNTNTVPVSVVVPPVATSSTPAVSATNTEPVTAIPSVAMPPTQLTQGVSATNIEPAPPVVAAAQSGPDTQPTVPSVVLAPAMPPSSFPSPPELGSLPVDVGDEHALEEDEDMPFPIRFRLESEAPASPNIFTPQSRQGSVVPSPPPSPMLEPAMLPSAVGFDNLGSAKEKPVPPSSPSLLPTSTVSAPAPSADRAVAFQSITSTSTGPMISSQLPSSITAAPRPLSSVPVATSVNPQARKAQGKENLSKDSPVVDTPAPADDRRPRREVKKMAKALSIEEEMTKKRGQKRPRTVVEDPVALEGVTSKRLQGASKTKGNRA